MFKADIQLGCKLIITINFTGNPTVTTRVVPGSGVLSVDQNGYMECQLQSESSTITTQVMWSTTATSANISNRIDFSSFITTLSQLNLSRVDSGYCGDYTCTFGDSDLRGTVSITVGKLG